MKQACGDTHSLKSLEEGIGQDIERSEHARGTHRLEREGVGQVRTWGKASERWALTSWRAKWDGQIRRGKSERERYTHRLKSAEGRVRT
jgi:hypothetical protein